MAGGIPYHSAQQYIDVLIASGLIKVPLQSKWEDPKGAKGWLNISRTGYYAGYSSGFE